jgi:hypothetical protein
LDPRQRPGSSSGKRAAGLHRQSREQEAAVRDIKYGVRVLLRSPGFTAVTALSLAISIGAGTALFSVADAALLRRLPVAQPDRLVVLRLGGWGDSASYRSFELLREASGNVLEGLAAYATRPLTLGGDRSGGAHRGGVPDNTSAGATRSANGSSASASGMDGPFANRC